MRPVQLTLDGFASFREPTTIDFGSAEYFALVGPTGSGKSTVLDAMIFALYGTAPRWGKKNAIADALAPTTSRCTVSLVFDVSGHRYEVAREVRRIGATPQQRNVSLVRFHDPTARTSDLDTCDVVAGEIKELQDAVVTLLGLSYENFCQSVVLPQGQFAQFLTAPARDRQKILLSLLGADQYELVRSEASVRAEASKQQVLALTAQQDHLADATDQAVTQLTIRRDQLITIESEIADGLPQVSRLDSMIADLDGQIESRQGQIQLTSAVTAPAGVAELQQHLTEARSAHTTAEQTLQTASTAYRDTVRAAEENPSQDTVKRWSAGYDEQVRLTADLSAAVRAAAEASRDRTAAEEELASARQILSVANDTARAAQAGLSEAQERARQADTRATRCEQVRAEIAALADQSAELSQARRSAADQAAAVAGLVTDRTVAEQAVEAAEMALEQARSRAEAAVLRPHLELGQDCPVCAQSVATLPPPLTDAGLDSAREARTAAQETQRRCAAAAAAAEEAQRARQQDIIVMERTIDAGWQRLTPVDGLPDEPGPAAAWIRTRADEAATALATARTAVTEAATEVETATSSLIAATAAESEHAQAREQALLAEQRAAAHRQALAEQLERIDATLTGVPPRDSLAELLTAAVHWAEARAKAEEATTTAEAELSAARHRLGASTDQVQNARQRFDHARDRLAVLNPPVIPTDDLPAAWSELAAWAGTTADELADQIRQLEHTRSGAARDRDRISESVRTRFAHAFGDEPCPALDQLGRRMVIEVEQARSAASRMADRVQQRTALTAQIATAQTEHDVAAQLRTLLRSNQFPQWLADNALDSLVATASHTLRRLSNDQFDLTHDRGEFAVIDHNDADSVRSVRTLSGGETFQASLALALALADQLAGMAGAAKLESMFLDEGFGTLDPESLEIVAATLENLASGDCTVGVVTHVQALAERIPVRFQVRRDSRTSSVTREAW